MVRKEFEVEDKVRTALVTIRGCYNEVAASFSSEPYESEPNILGRT
jgi:hypothetical protein